MSFVTGTSAALGSATTVLTVLVVAAAAAPAAAADHSRDLSRHQATEEAHGQPRVFVASSFVGD